MSPTLGFVGLGRMGTPMAHHLLRAGHPLVVHDLDEGRVAELVAAGATAAVDAADVAARSDVSITMLLNDQVLRTVVTGDRGIATGAAPGHVLCDLSTVSPRVTREVADAITAKGARFVTGAVAGSVQPAHDGALTVFLSGAGADVDRLTPLLSPFAASVTAVGDDLQAVYLKLVPSHLVAAYSAIVAEALTFGQAGGLDLATTVRILESGPLGSRQLSIKADMLVARAFADPPSDVDTAAKDVDILLEAARDLKVPMPLSSAARQVMAHQQARGRGRRDIWSVLEAFESLADLDTGAGRP